MLNPAFWWLLAVKFPAFCKLRPRRWGEGVIHCWSPTFKLGTSLPRSPWMLRLWIWLHNILTAIKENCMDIIRVLSCCEMFIIYYFFFTNIILTDFRILNEQIKTWFMLTQISVYMMKHIYKIRRNIWFLKRRKTVIMLTNTLHDFTLNSLIWFIEVPIHNKMGRFLFVWPVVKV